MIWARWTRLLNEREMGTSLALFRIGCGLTMLATLGRVVIHGLAPVVWLDAADGGYATLGEPPYLFQLLGGLTPATLWPVLTVALISACLLAVGLGGRLSAFVALQSYLAISEINSHITGFDDRLIQNALWLLVLARSTATLSLDCRLRTGSWKSTMPVYAWPRYLAIYQLVLMYFTTGLQKLSAAWTPGGDFAALYYILQHPLWQRWDMGWLAWVFPLTQVATAITWFWEVSSPLLLLALWYRRTRERRGWLRAFFNRIDFRRVFVIIGVCMHLGIWLFLDLGPFTWIALSFYACLFLPEEWHSAWRKMRRWFHPKANRQEHQGQPLRPVERCTHRTVGWKKWAIYAFVTLHVIAVTLMAVPAPVGVMHRTEWQTPLVQGEFTEWTRRLNAWGMNLTPMELQDWAWNTARRYMTIREKVLAPFQPYYKYCGTSQGWRMFVGPILEPTTLQIEIRENAKWQAIYAAGDPHHRWRASQLGHEHMRTAFFTIGFNERHADLKQFARWAAVRAAPDFPKAKRLRVRVDKIRTLSPAEVRAGRRPVRRTVMSVVMPLKKKSPP